MGKFSGNGPVQKHIYKIDVSKATDVSAANDSDELGLLINNKTLEESTWEELEAAGIQPVSKVLVADLVNKTGYPHDKLEGIWLIDNHTLGCINDDDFAVTDEDDNGIIEQKILPGTAPAIDASSLYMIKANF